MGVSATVISELAPTGTLRVGITCRAFCSRERAVEPEPASVGVDLGRELGRRLGIAVHIVHYQKPRALADARRSAYGRQLSRAEPHRANETDCSAAYVESEADRSSALRLIDEVDGAQYLRELVEDIKGREFCRARSKTRASEY
jgi:hypothetical protein